MLITLLLAFDPAPRPAFDVLGARIAAIQSSSAPTESSSGQDAKALAEKLSNPIASLISVPFQFNFDSDIGPGDRGDRAVLNIQPVVPFELNEDWNLISRTILPLISQDDVVPGTDQSGTGDIVQSLFFSPKAPTASGWIWGAGPVFLIPTASDDLLGSEKWGVGPTAVFLKQQSGWTYGALMNHLWSVAGEEERADVNATFVQPFVSRTTANAWTYALNTETTYDWESEEWSIPVNLVISKLIRLGSQHISIGAGLRYWADSAPNGPEGFGFRFIITPLFPK
ncbi:MAG: transporter [Planctomycetota bacterium]|nr:transporter [Planctomycetota bacterium]